MHETGVITCVPIIIPLFLEYCGINVYYWKYTNIPVYFQILGKEGYFPK